MQSSLDRRLFICSNLVKDYLEMLHTKCQLSEPSGSILQAQDPPGAGPFHALGPSFEQTW